MRMQNTTNAVRLNHRSNEQLKTSYLDVHKAINSSTSAHSPQTVSINRGKSNSYDNIDQLLDGATLRQTILVIRAVNHKLRKSIMFALEQNGQMTVTEIYVKLRLPQSVVSQHLGVLRKAGIVQTNKRGKFIHYSLNENRLNQLSYLLMGVRSAQSLKYLQINKSTL